MLQSALRAIGLAVLAFVPAELWADIVFDPALGLPDLQGFFRIEEEGPPAPSISGGVLHQDTSANPLFHQWWIRPASEPINFANGFAISARINVVSAPMIINGQNEPRGGYEVGAGDDTGRYLSFTLSDSQVWIDTSGWGSPGSTAFANVDTHAFHDYLLFALGSTAHLFVDGAEVASIALGGSLPNGSAVGFGEHTGATFGIVDVASIQFASVPEPGTWALAGFAAVIAGLFRAKRRKMAESCAGSTSALEQRLQ